MNLAAIQQALLDEGLDGWLFFDHHQRDPLAYRVLGLSPPPLVSRRWYYLIPAQGEPKGLVHRIEPFMLEGVPGEKRQYSSWSEQLEGLRGMLAGCRRVAMQYSPECAVPLVSMVDAGTVELVRATGVEVASSANLIQYFEARWTQANLDLHLEAGRKVDEIRRAAFQLVSERLRAGRRVTEFEVQQFFRQRLRTGGPRDRPRADDRGQRELLESALRAAGGGLPRNPPRGPVAYGHLGEGGPAGRRLLRHHVDGILRCRAAGGGPERLRDRAGGARPRGEAGRETAVAAGRPLRGFEVDDAARGCIRERGYGEHFTHRTGHSIGAEVHGAGANMDNLETHDERRIIPWTCFSIEPGIYLPEFGIRSEVNVFVGEDRARVTGEIQERLVIL